MKKKEEKNNAMEIVGLLLNLFIPGLGSVINKTKNGVFILILAAISIPLMFVLIGFLTGLIAWVWGIIDMVVYMRRD
jgi:TM2 domain-containing membrane protein YozV